MVSHMTRHATIPDRLTAADCFAATLPDATDALRATSNEGLLTTYRALVHRIDNARQHQSNAASDRGHDRWNRHAESLIEQRDLVHAEVLRRMGGE